MKHLLTIATFLLFRTAYAQHTEISYYDADHKETRDTASAVYRKKIVFHSPSNDNTGTLSYFTNDTLTTIAHSNDLERKIWHGKVTRYRRAGTILEVLNYENDKKEGASLQYFSNGVLAVQGLYVNDSLMSERFYTPEGRDTTENLHTRKATPPPDYKDVIAQHLQYPQKAKSRNRQGRVMVSFVVEKDGTVSNVKVEEYKLGAGLEEEAIRVVSLLPHFKPALLDGSPVRYRFRIPIDFKLEGHKKKANKNRH